MADRMTLGWLGIGRMGAAMSLRLVKAGHDVTVWNRTSQRPVRKWPSPSTIWPPRMLF